MVSNNQQGKNVVLTFSGDNAEAYLMKIENDGLVYLNGDWRELGKDKYTVDLEHNTITFQAKCFAVGKNSIRLKSAGYKVQDVTFEYSKVNETVTSLTVTQENDVVHISVNESDGDFLKNLKSITLTKDGKEDTVWTKGVEGSDAVYYVLAADYKSVDLYNVTTPGDYTVKIQANYYGENGTSAEFTVTGEVELTPVPDMTIVTSETGGVYRVEFHEKTNAATANEIGRWKLAVKKITVNGVEYSECGFPSAPKASTAEYSWTYSQGAKKSCFLVVARLRMVTIKSSFKQRDTRIYSTLLAILVKILAMRIRQN